MTTPRNFLFFDDLIATFATSVIPSIGGGRQLEKIDVGRYTTFFWSVAVKRDRGLTVTTVIIQETSNFKLLDHHLVSKVRSTSWDPVMSATPRELPHYCSLDAPRLNEMIFTKHDRRYVSIQQFAGSETFQDHLKCTTLDEREVKKKLNPCQIIWKIWMVMTRVYVELVSRQQSSTSISP